MRTTDGTIVHDMPSYLVELCTAGYYDESAPPLYEELSGDKVCRFGKRLYYQTSYTDWVERYASDDEAHAALDALHCGHGIPDGRPCYRCDCAERANQARDRWKDGG